jgi:hypothetical protein
MSAIPGLLRVMSLRDAEAIILETGKVPTLRRRGQLEALAMPALEPTLLEEFVAPLVAGRDEWPTTVTFTDDAGSYQCTIDKTAAGMRIIAKKGKPPACGSTAASRRSTSTSTIASSPRA